MPVKAIQLGSPKVCRVLGRRWPQWVLAWPHWAWAHNHYVKKCWWFQYFCQNQRKPNLLSSSAVTRPYCDFLLRQKHPSLPTALPQQQVFMLAEPKRKTTFWHNIGRLTPFKKWKEEKNGSSEVVEEGNEGEDEELSARAWINPFKIVLFLSCT